MRKKPSTQMLRLCHPNLQNSFSWLLGPPRKKSKDFLVLMALQELCLFVPGFLSKSKVLFFPMCLFVCQTILHGGRLTTFLHVVTCCHVVGHEVSPESFGKVLVGGWELARSLRQSRTN